MVIGGPPGVRFEPLKLPNFDFNADPDPAFHSNVDPDLASYIMLDPNPFVPEFRIRIHLIWIGIQHFRLNTDPDPGFL
jgi:hypothetical protein